MRYLSKNPELQKNIWLELSYQRLILMPVIISVILFLIFSSGFSQYDIMTCCSFGIYIIMLWGCKVAHDNIINEYNERTWDWQRMSALTPKQLLIGKLFGATIYNWYGILICLLLWLIFSFIEGKTSLIGIVVNGLSFILQAISLMCFSIITALIRIRKGNGRDRIKGAVIWTFLLVVFLILSSFLNMYIAHYNDLFKISILDSDPYYLRILGQNVFYTCWAIIGLKQVFRKELSYKNSSGYWYLFVVSSSIVLAWTWRHNLTIDKTNFGELIVASFVIHALLLTYFLLIFEPKEIIELKMLFKNIKKRNLQYLNLHAPLWILTFPLIFIALFFLGTMCDPWLTGLKWLRPFFSLSFIDTIEPPIGAFFILLSIIFFIIRDFALMLLISMSSKNKNAEALFVFYLFLIYIFVPHFTTINDMLASFFRPTLAAGNLSFIFPAIEAAIVIFLLVRNKNWREVNGNKLLNS